MQWFRQRTEHSTQSVACKNQETGSKDNSAKRPFGRSRRSITPNVVGKQSSGHGSSNDHHASLIDLSDVWVSVTIITSLGPRLGCLFPPPPALHHASKALDINLLAPWVKWMSDSRVRPEVIPDVFDGRGGIDLAARLASGKRYSADLFGSERRLRH
ncbi:hypothetical protein OE88DRAFT_813532 [Heliocybe sulcata]|uniref:Uncharacterized protein n=1 Tax=Heliocybe sulcata TaxID=5364 RepID=A0A5C3MTK1_9AGAM|nr:hypothetical protein OE88DRAFT_813532 [Heliocybe sulcata]